jgi:citrate lyase subunit beta / citryl-CoA lyase
MPPPSLHAQTAAYHLKEEKDHAMRSLLFVPGDSDKKQAKSLTCGADVLILDLEDSVAPARKAAAREMTRAWLNSIRAQPKRPQLYVRMNALSSPYWQDDLAGVMAAQPDGIMLPKPHSGADVERLALNLAAHEDQCGITPGSTRILPIATEVPISVLQMATYIGSSTRLSAITWGAEDLATEIGASANRTLDGTFTSPFQMARDLTLFTATASGLPPIDTVFVNFRDAGGLEREAKAAARDGFTGKLAIHPDQVAVINAAFTPTAEAIARAQAITKLFADNPGAGALSMDGQMVDIPHLKHAERLLARAAM